MLRHWRGSVALSAALFLHNTMPFPGARLRATHGVTESAPGCCSLSITCHCLSFGVATARQHWPDHPLHSSLKNNPFSYTLQRCLVLREVRCHATHGSPRLKQFIEVIEKRENKQGQTRLRVRLPVGEAVILLTSPLHLH